MPGMACFRRPPSVTTMTQASARQLFLTGSPNEEKYGYCRAIRVGERILVSGCTAMIAGGVAPEHKGNMLEQTREAMRRVGQALAHFGLGFEHIVFTRVFITDASQLPQLIQGHGEVFGAIKPGSTCVGTPFLFHPDLLVEIEVEAQA